VEEYYLITTLKIHRTFETTNNTMSEVNGNERSLSEVELAKIMPIIKHLQRHGNISPKEARKLTGKSSATVRRYLSALCDHGILTISGKTTSLTYSLNGEKRMGGTKTESD